MSGHTAAITARSSCRACGGGFDPLLDLGAPILSAFPRPDEADPMAAPLDLVQCQRCELVQLRHTVDPELLYREYWYRSGVNEGMRAELADIVRSALQIVPNPDIVIDIGANDGTLLSNYYPPTFRVAVDPARTVKPVYADEYFNDFFPAATTHCGSGQVDIITSIACFYDLDDPKAFVAEIDRLLAPDGVWIVQMQDLGQMIAATAYDNIVAEHLCYYTPDTFAALLEDFDFAITQIEPRAINGGSLRFTIRRRKHAKGLPAHLGWEVSRDRLAHFAWRVGEHTASLLGILDRVVARHHAIDLIGASTKASTLLQHAGLDHRTIRCAVERTPEKVGRVTSGTRIPIVSEEDWRVDPAPVALLGIWQWREGILRREAEYLARGGSIVVPLPSVEVVCGAL